MVVLYHSRLRLEQPKVHGRWIWKLSTTICISTVDGNNLYFHSGWEQFVQDNSLQYGDFLLFSYGGNSKFHVKIFGKNGCEREVTHCTDDGTRGFPIPEVNHKNEKSASISGRRVGRPRVVAKRMKTSSCFEVVLKEYHKRYLTIPRAFAYEAGIERKKNVLLENKKGKIWRVGIRKRTHAGACGRIDTSTGWRDFWDDNKLKLKDSCLFKFVPGSDNIIQVKITQAK